MLIWPALVIVLGLCVPGESTSHIPCGSVDCADNGICDSPGSCSCPEGYVGVGTFGCYPGSNDLACIRGPNNTLKTFFGSRDDLLWPCRARVTEFVAPRRLNAETGTGENCSVQVFALSQMIEDEIQVTGFEVHFLLEAKNVNLDGIAMRKETRLASTNPSGSKYFSLAKSIWQHEQVALTNDADDDDDGEPSGVSGNGEMDDDEEEDSSSGWGPPDSLDIGYGETVECVVDDQNFAHVQIPSCGVSVDFNGPHTPPEERRRPVGLSIAVDSETCADCGKVEFVTPATYLAEDPHNNIHAANAEKKGITLAQDFLHVAMTNPAEQDDTEQGQVCKETARTYRENCPNQSAQVAALKLCSAFLSNGNVRNCMNSNEAYDGPNSLTAFKYCVHNSCDSSKTVCLLLRNLVYNKECESHLPYDIRDVIDYC